MKIERILVTTDFSDQSRHSFPAAASLARRFSAELHLVHVLETVPPDFFFSSEGIQGYSLDVDYPEKFRQLLRELAGCEEFEGISVRHHLLEGGLVYERLSNFQKEMNIDLMVISTHGRTGLGHLLLGSFAEKAVRLSFSPVLTCRKCKENSRGFLPERILVPFDFSENGRVILDPVRFFADEFGAKVRFQHVLEPLPDLVQIPWEEISVDEIRERRLDAPQRGKQELEKLIRNEFPGRPGFEAVAEFGNPFVDIVRGAREFEADLIIMATHGWTGLKHMLLGSVAEKVVRKAPCSVLTVRPADFSFEQP
jgi:nucleotide-binding universal stress UspA family protein